MTPARRRQLPRGVGVVLLAVTAVALALGVARSGTAAPARTPNAAPARTPTAPMGTATTSTTAPKASTATPAAWSRTTVTMAYGGVTRSYLLVRPVGATGSLPVVVALHGHSVTPAYEDTRMDFEAVSGAAVLVFPEGTGESWNAGHCCAPAETSGVDDVGFVEAVARSVDATVPGADPARTYLVGYSNGGKLALDLACTDPGQWRAVAVYGATEVAPCAHRSAGSLLLSASTDDPELTIGPGGTPHTVEGFVQPTVTGQLDAASAAAGCPATGATATAGLLSTTTWSCPGGRRVELALYAGQAHNWPQASGATPSEAATMWAFFASLGA